MKRILMIVENKLSLEPMLTKALRFSPKEIHLHCFESSGADEAAAGIQTTVDDLVKDQCQIHLTVEAAVAKKQMSEWLESILDENDFEMILLHGPRKGKDLSDLSLIKTAIRSPKTPTILLSGDSNWNKDLKVLATVDILHDNAAQGSLNKQVLTTAVEYAGYLKAETEVMSVIAFSRVNTELEVLDPAIILKKRRAGIKAKLKEFIVEANCSADIPVNVAAGLTPVEISNVAKKRKADIVVMGNVGRRGIKGFLVGNTAEKILNRLPVDALLVHQ